MLAGIKNGKRLIHIEQGRTMPFLAGIVQFFRNICRDMPIFEQVLEKTANGSQFAGHGAFCKPGIEKMGHIALQVAQAYVLRLAKGQIPLLKPVFKLGQIRFIGAPGRFSPPFLDAAPGDKRCNQPVTVFQG